MTEVFVEQPLASPGSANNIFVEGLGGTMNQLSHLTKLYFKSTSLSTYFLLFILTNLVMLINRPGVAGAVLHTASSLINRLSQSVSLFLQIFIIS